MNLCIRLPWFNQRKPFVAFYCRRWGTHYSAVTCGHHRFVYKAGVGIGRVVERFYRDEHRRDPAWAPGGRWKWHYWNGKWQ